MAPAGKRARAKGPGRNASAPAVPVMAVRMLVGPYAGQVVRVSREEGARLCGGWQPQAEPVAVNPVDLRETRDGKTNERG